MFQRSLMVLVIVALVVPSTLLAEEEEYEAPVPVEKVDCLPGVAAENYAGALESCRDKLAADPQNPELMRALARCEFAAGEPERAVELWSEILGQEGWSAAAAHDKAMALWRAGKSTEAEPILREIIKREPSPAAYRALVDYLLSFDRVKEALASATTAVERYPEVCELHEDLAVACAAADQDEQAAAAVAKAIELGCPKLRWLGRGMLAQNHDRPAYAELLTPQVLIEDLPQLTDAQVRARFTLLKPRMVPEVAPQVVDVVLHRTTSEVRLAGLGLLTELGAKGLPYWSDILSTGDFILEKHALRRIREMGDPAFLDLLRQRLDAQQTPGNRALTQLTIGELLLTTGDLDAAVASMEAIDDDDQLHPVAMMALADYFEAHGDPAAALAYIERARTADKRMYIAPTRLEKLERAVQGKNEE